MTQFRSPKVGMRVLVLAHAHELGELRATVADEGCYLFDHDWFYLEFSVDVIYPL